MRTELYQVRTHIFLCLVKQHGISINIHTVYIMLGWHSSRAVCIALLAYLCMCVSTQLIEQNILS